MSFWIEGWIEITCDSPLEEYEHSWQGVVRLLPLNCGADDVSLRLFGLLKVVTAGDPPDPEALAPKRGKPPNPSSELRDDFDRIAQHEERYGPGEYGGYTFAEWSEIEAAELTLPEDSEWVLVFDITKRLARMSDATRVRIVAWYNW